MVAKKAIGHTKKRDPESNGSSESNHSHTSDLVLSMGTQSEAVSGLKSSKSRKPGKHMTSSEIQGMFNLQAKTDSGPDHNLDQGLRRIQTGD